MNRHTSFAVLLGAALLASCSIFDVTAVENRNAELASARIKFSNFSVGSVGVNFFANTTKMTGISTTNCASSLGLLPTVDSLKTKCLATGIEATTGTAYAAAAANGLYVAIAPGNFTLTAKKAATDTTISTVTQTIAAGKYYSYFMSGLYNATTLTAEAFVVEDAIPAAFDYTKALVRFVNAIPNGTGDITLTVTNTSTTTATDVGAATAYKAGSAFIAVAEGAYTAQGKYGATNVTGLSRTSFNLIGGHAYTLTARGTTVGNAVALDLTENQR